MQPPPIASTIATAKTTKCRHRLLTLNAPRRTSKSNFASAVQLGAAHQCAQRRRTGRSKSGIAIAVQLGAAHHCAQRRRRKSGIAFAVQCHAPKLLHCLLFVAGFICDRLANKWRFSRSTRCARRHTQQHSSALPSFGTRAKRVRATMVVRRLAHVGMCSETCEQRLHLRRALGTTPWVPAGPGSPTKRLFPLTLTLTLTQSFFPYKVTP